MSEVFTIRNPFQTFHESVKLGPSISFKQQNLKYEYLFISYNYISFLLIILVGPFGHFGLIKLSYRKLVKKPRSFESVVLETISML